MWFTTRQKLRATNLCCIYDIRLNHYFGSTKADQFTCTLCLKQPLSMESAASEIVFLLVYKLYNFCFHQDTTYQLYIYCVRFGVTLPLERLIPFARFPNILLFIFTLFDNLSLGHNHEHRAWTVDVRNGTRWMDALQYQFGRPALFVSHVAQLKGTFWCAHCERALF
jgi:hypothetical protein